MNARELAMRDPALAILTGAMSGDDFGNEASFGADFGDDVGDDVAGDFGDELHGDFGDDYGAEFGLARTPTAAQSMALWSRYRGAKMRTMRREMKLYPNKGSSLQLEEFSFPLNPTTNPVFGVASASNMTNNPDVTIRPERIVFNVPSLGLYLIAEVKTANVGCLVGAAATQDAGMFGPTSVGVRLSCPTLSPQNKLTIIGSWQALVPAGGFVNGTAYPLGASAIGPAKMAG